MPLLQDLQELKSLLELPPDDRLEDKNLYFWLDYATDVIEEAVGRRGLFYKARTEYYDGTGTQLLCLRSRPVVAAGLRVWIDEDALAGTASDAFPSTTELTYGEGFYLKTDGEDNASSRSGILVRVNDFWPKPFARQRGTLSPFVADDTGSIKVTYTGGYSIDALPPAFRLACALLVSKLRYIFPLGLEVSSDSYEGKSIGINATDRRYLLNLVRPLVFTYQNIHLGR